MRSGVEKRRRLTQGRLVNARRLPSRLQLADGVERSSATRPREGVTLVGGGHDVAVPSHPSPNVELPVVVAPLARQAEYAEATLRGGDLRHDVHAARSARNDASSNGRENVVSHLPEGAMVARSNDGDVSYHRERSLGA